MTLDTSYTMTIGGQGVVGAGAFPVLNPGSFRGYIGPNAACLKCKKSKLRAGGPEL